MSGYLPYGGFEWLKNADNSDINSISEKSPIRYILKVDLKYPDELHVLDVFDYPLAPEELAIPYDMLSDYCKKVADEYEIKVGDKRTNAANSFEKDFFKLKTNSVYGKTIENLRKRISH